MHTIEIPGDLRRAVVTHAVMMERRYRAYQESLKKYSAKEQPQLYQDTVRRLAQQVERMQGMWDLIEELHLTRYVQTAIAREFPK